MKRTCVIVIAIGLMALLNNCRYDNIITPSSNIILYDKPLDVIRANVQGHWKLLYAEGGLSWGIYPAKYNSYMNITGDHIVEGNDSLGVILDTVIVWRRDKCNGGYTYFLTYIDSRNLFFPYEAIVDRIKNDTLIIIDNANDGYSKYYLKIKQP